MNEKKEHLDRIHAYLQGSLTEAEQVSFVEDLRADEAFAKLFEEERRLAVALWALAEEDRQEKLFEIGKEVSPQKDKQAITKPLRRKTWLRMAVGIAAAVLVAFWVLPPSTSSSLTQEDLYTHQFNPKDVLLWMSAPRGGEEESAFAKAAKFMEKGDFKLAIPVLQNLQADPRHEIKATYYLGVCYLKSQEERKAAELFSQIPSSSASYYAPAQWYRALALLRKAPIEEVRQALQPILDNPAHYKHQEARDIEASLKALQD